jgi:hypothetical protein
MRRVRMFPVAIAVGATLILGLAACGSSGGTSDVSDVSTTALQSGDLPSAFTVGTAKTFDTFASYAAGSGVSFGQLGTHCGVNPTTAEKSNFAHGLAQTALNAQQLGVMECVEVVNSDANAKSEYNDAVTALNKSKSLRHESVNTVGDQAFGFSASQSGVAAHVIGWRHANALLEIVYIDKQDVVKISDLQAAAGNVDGRLK